VALDLPWIEDKLREMRRFGRSLATQDRKGLPDSLDADSTAQLAALPALAESATAIHLSMRSRHPLRTCLQATQACLGLLPITALELQLRSSRWSDDEAHALRREWLHRLTHLKAQATRQLLDQGKRDLQEAGRQLWSGHHNWNELMRAGQWDEASEEGPSRTEVMLALARLESLIDETAHTGEA